MYCIIYIGGSEIQRDLLEVSTTDTPTLKLEQGDDPG